MLHFQEIRRLSIDIDIVCGAPTVEVDTVVARIGALSPFVRVSPDPRGNRGLPNRRHFKFFFNSVLPGPPEAAYVLLDVVEESAIHHRTESKPISTPFLIPDREIRVIVPTVESLLGDKLTAFAPNTIGVPLRKPDGTERDAMQVAKQLFDVGALFDVARDFEAVRETYDHLQAQEAGYRGQGHTRDACLDDTIRACMGITAINLRPVVKRRFNSHDNPPQDFDLLWRGFEAMRSHAGDIGYERARTFAAKAACLALHLKHGRDLDLVATRYSGDPNSLRTLTLNRTRFAWLDPIKATNPEAFYYWSLVARLAAGE